MARPRSARWVLGMMGTGVALGGVVGFVQGYLDLPDAPLPAGAEIDNWHHRMEVTGAHWEGLIGSIVGLLAAAAATMAWRAFVGLVLGAVLGFVAGNLIGSLACIGGCDEGGALMALLFGYVAGPVVGAALGFAIGIGRDLVARSHSDRNTAAAGRDRGPTES